MANNNFAKCGDDVVNQFVVSGIPFVTGTVANELVTGSAVCIKFPYVTSWMQVCNASTNAANILKVGFTENGVLDGNAFLVPGGTAARAEGPVWNLQCTELWLAASAGTPQLTMVAGLTQIPASSFGVLTGSNGTQGVG